jgi:hypothetical protein
MMEGLGVVAGIFEIARVRGSTNNEVGPRESLTSSSLSSDEESRSSMALGWVWIVSKNEVGEEGGGAE